MASKCESNHAGDSDMPKGSYKVFSLNEKVVYVKQGDCQLFLQQKWVQGQPRIAVWSLQPRVMCKFPDSKEKRTLLKEGEGSREDYCKQSSLEKLRVWSTMAFHWLHCDSFNWLKSWQARRGRLSSAHWALLSS